VHHADLLDKAAMTSNLAIKVAWPRSIPQVWIEPVLVIG
jgi:glutaredoxin-related protein